MLLLLVLLLLLRVPLTCVGRAVAACTTWLQRRVELNATRLLLTLAPENEVACISDDGVLLGKRQVCVRAIALDCRQSGSTGVMLVNGVGRWLWLGWGEGTGTTISGRLSWSSPNVPGGLCAQKKRDFSTLCVLSLSLLPCLCVDCTH